MVILFFGGYSTSDEVIIVDDGSTLSSKEELKATLNALKLSNLQVIFAEHGGIGSARNIGVSAAKKPYLLFVDDDVIAAGDWLETMRQTSLHSKAVQGNYWATPKNNRLAIYHQLWRKAATEAKVKETQGRLGTVNTRNFAIKKKVLVDICGCEPFAHGRGGSDYLVGAKLYDAGVGVLLNEKAILHHTGDPDNLIGLVKQKYLHASGDAQKGLITKGTFLHKGFYRAVVRPKQHGVPLWFALPLWAAYLCGAAAGLHTGQAVRCTYIAKL